ncbi:RNA polymerase sigma factor [Hymenobacter sp. BT683]|uniref:RNA polymerase sigma factor n=1 Tax=Hymenobacter jeongseonensis TaxID=2791027 RepID=A0ABS0IF31_9BACT|nr:RNA polymerase sigma factor [Hymenobacter jeongseonensis]MBF9236964.1 RNA polymerase sigma factor [Hymenobacter jeongseonensis]
MTTTSTSDEELMAAVKADDLDQLVPLFERYHGPLFNYLTRLTNDRDTSEDLTQTVFERILKYRSSYQPTQPFKAWVYQMARNVHADYWQRKEKLRAADVEEVEKTGGLRGAAFSQMRISSHHDDLHEALALLPTPQREILVLNRFQGFGYEEIGQLLGCTAEAARVKAHRALQALRKIYFAN